MEAIIGYTPSERQTALLSSTMPAWVAKTARKHLRNPVKVSVDAELQAPPTVHHMVYTIERSQKIGALQSLLNEREDYPVIVFGRTKRGVRKLARQLDTLGYPVGALQGNLSQNARERVMADFRSGDAPILVATNVAARGIDVEGVGQVINYDLPDSEILFTHRVGRTGRMGRAGEAITFITPDEEKKWGQLERGLDLQFTREPGKATPGRSQTAGAYDVQSPCVGEINPDRSTHRRPDFLLIHVWDLKCTRRGAQSSAARCDGCTECPLSCGLLRHHPWGREIWTRTGNSWRRASP